MRLSRVSSPVRELLARGWLVPVLVLIGLLAYFVIAQAPSPKGQVQGVDRAVVDDRAKEDAATGLPEPEAADRSERATGSEVPAVVPGEQEEEPAPGGLRVRVLDASGAPVPAIDVELLGRIPGVGDGGQWGKGTSTSPDGIARIDLAELGERLERMRAYGMEPELRVQADVACSPAPSVELAGPLVDGAEVELSLPATGSVVVRVVDQNGSLLETEADVYFWWQAREELERNPNGGQRRIGRHHRSTSKGVARFDGIGLDVVLSFTAWVEGLEGGSLAGVEGPARVGEERAVDIRVGPERPRIRFRVVDARGAPIADTRIEAQFVQLPGDEASRGRARPSVQTTRTDTDFDGVAELWSNAREWDVERALDVVVRTPDVHARDDPNWRCGSAPLPRVIPAATTIDLGEIRVGPVPVFAEGVVVDDAGTPLAGVDLRFQEVYGESWNDRKNLQDGKLESDDNGHFRLRGTRAPARLGLQVWLKGYESLTLTDIPVGDRNLVLELHPEARVEPEPTGKLAIELAMPKGTPFTRLSLYWKADGSSGSTECPPPGVGPFELEDLAPGSYAVWVKSRDGHLKFARVEGVEVRAGETTRDPRLLPLDLANELRTVQLQLVHPSGKPLHKARPRIVLEEAGASFSVRAGEEGRAVFVVPKLTTRLGVRVDGGAAVHVALPTDDALVRVEVP